MTITIQCETFDEAQSLRAHLLRTRPFKLADVPNPVALRIGNAVDVYTDTDYNKLYLDGWLAGWKASAEEWY